MTRLATSWLVYRMTHSALLLGVVSFAGQIISFLLGPFAGVWVERLNRRKLLLWTQALAAVQSLALAALTLTHVINLWEIIALAALQGTINAFDMPGRQSFLVQMVEDRNDLSNAIAINSSMANGARLIGPAIAGLLIGVAGEGWCFLVDGISYVAVIASLLLMRIKPTEIRRSASSMLAQMREGWDYVRNFLPIRTILLLFAILSLMGWPYAVLLPVFAAQVLHGGPHTLGWLTGASGIGALVSGLSLTLRKSVVGLTRMLQIATTILGIALILFGFSHTLWLSLVLMLFVGFGLMQGAAISNTIIQSLVAEDKRARVMSYYTMAFFGAAPFGSLLAGALAQFIGAPHTVILTGLSCLLGALWFTFRLPKVRAIIRPIYQEMGLMRPTVAGLALFVTISVSRAAPIPPAHVDQFTGHPRLIVISDIGNEPDDQMSLTRLLLYSNQIDIEALIASTSTWQKTITHPETMRALIDAYAKVQPNLLLHAPGWPTGQQLQQRVFSGQSAYGMAATGPNATSEGAQAIIQAVDRNDSRPVWIACWGGVNTLAQALIRVRATRSPAVVEKFVEKLRVYSISDQDDARPWIRREFPDLFYIVQPSTPTGGEYYYATWTGISGDAYYRNGAGANPATVTNDWLETNIRSKGPLGKLYPKFLFIMEGDTPSFLGLIDNGLNAYRRPDWGGWGGRYVYLQPYGETHPIWTQGGDLFSRVTSQDTVTGVDGKTYVSDQATVWRWRDAFQNDFAARMSWTINDYAHANHPPNVEVNGHSGTQPVVVNIEVGKPLLLDASATTDPDGQNLHFDWFHYAEAGSTGTSLAAITLAGSTTAKAIVTATSTCQPGWLPLPSPCPATGTAHIILAVTDEGSPKLTSYRRIILQVHQ